MPKSRQPNLIWLETRKRVYERDNGRCQGPYCKDKQPHSITLEECHIDHIQSGLRGTNNTDNLRTLCRYCHVLRADFRHGGMRAKAISDGIIPADWRPLVWGD